MTDQFECHNYTSGRRYPMVLGRISDFALPWPVTMPQLAAGLAGLAVALATRGLWRVVVGASPLAGLLVLLAATLIPIVAARPTRVEGRSLLAATAGQVRLWTRPGRGVCNGRAVPRPRRHRPTGPVVVEAAPAPGSDGAAAQLATRPVWSSVR